MSDQWAGRVLAHEHSRITRAVALAVVAAFAYLALSQLTTPGWWWQDAEAYWNAAVRLRTGVPLYPILANPDASDTYRYAPWFAAAWVPLTFLPRTAVLVAWTAILGAAAAYCVWIPARARSAAGVALAILGGALLVPAAASGNVQPLLVALLLWGVERRSGPLWIAAAASLKAAPLLLIAIYVGRRQWWRAGGTLVITAVLVGPMLLFDLTHYPTGTAAATGPLATWLSVAFGLALAARALFIARTRYGWLWAAAAVVFAIPRWSYYQPSMLLVGLAQRPRDEP